MTPLRSALYALVLLISAAASARAQTSARLSAEQAVALALDHDLALKRDRFGPKVAELELGATATAWTPSVFTRFFNGSSDSTSLNFLLDDDVEGPQLAFLESTPDFQTVDNKTRDLRIQEDGTSVDLWSEVVDLTADRDYLISAVGLENYGTETLKRVRTVFTQIDRTAPNGSRARLVIIHGYNRQTGLETPNIDFQTPGDNPQFRSPNIAYASSQVLEVDAGTWTFEARRQGTETILVSQSVTLGGGKIYAAYVLGVENAGGAQAPRIEFVELQAD